MNGVPNGYRALQPYLICRNAAEALDFYAKVFGGEIVRRSLAPDGKRILHGEVRIGDSVLLLCDEFPELNCLSPQSFNGNGNGCGIHHFVDDVDAVFHRAVIAGSDVKAPPMEMFWGDRFCRFVDPYGHLWSVATRVENLTPDEIERRGHAFFAAQAQQQQQ